MLKGVGASVIGLGASPAVAQATTGSDAVEIDVTVTGSQTTEVPRDWYQRVKAAERVLERSNIVRRLDGVVGKYVDAGKFGGENPHVVIDIEAGNEDARGQIPERIGGLRVDVVEREYAREASTDNYDFGDSIPGGAEIEKSDDNQFGALTSRILHENDDGEYFGTAQHVTGVCNGSDNSPTIHHPEDVYDGSEIGTVLETWNFEDFAVIEPTSSESPVSQVADPDNLDDSSQWYDIDGTFTKDAIQTLKADNATVRKVGPVTDMTSGTISKVGTSTFSGGCAWEKKGQVEWGDGSDIDQGDSGSLAFAEAPDSSDNCAVCVNVIELDRAVSGTGVYRIKDKTGYYCG